MILLENSLKNIILVYSPLTSNVAINFWFIPNGAECYIFFNILVFNLNPDNKIIEDHNFVIFELNI